MYAPVQAPDLPTLPAKSIRVMIVDDSAVVRGLVARWIEEESGLEVVARHANGWPSRTRREALPTSSCSTSRCR